MFVQFLLFPWAAKRYGVLRCLRTVSVIFPIIYFVTPFSVLVPSSFRNITIFLVTFSRLTCGIFCFPCCIILLTNSASTRTVLGTLNGVATSASAVGRATGPAILGSMFSYGVKKGFMIIPWWTLTVIAVLSSLPSFWIVEMDGSGEDNDESCEDDFDIDDEQTESRTGVYGATVSGASSSAASRST